MSTLMSTDMNISRPTSRVSTAPGGASSMSELLTHTCTPVHKHLVKTPAKEDHMFGIFQNTVDKNMEAGSEPILPLPGKYYLFLFFLDQRIKCFLFIYYYSGTSHR